MIRLVFEPNRNEPNRTETESKRKETRNKPQPTESFLSRYHQTIIMATTAQVPAVVLSDPKDSTGKSAISESSSARKGNKYRKFASRGIKKRGNGKNNKPMYISYHQGDEPSVLTNEERYSPAGWNIGGNDDTNNIQQLQMQMQMQQVEQEQRLLQLKQMRLQNQIQQKQIQKSQLLLANTAPKQPPNNPTIHGRSPSPAPNAQEIAAYRIVLDHLTRQQPRLVDGGHHPPQRGQGLPARRRAPSKPRRSLEYEKYHEPRKTTSITTMETPYFSRNHRHRMNDEDDSTIDDSKVFETETEFEETTTDADTTDVDHLTYDDETTTLGMEDDRYATTSYEHTEGEEIEYEDHERLRRASYYNDVGCRRSDDDTRDTRDTRDWYVPKSEEEDIYGEAFADNTEDPTVHLPSLDFDDSLQYTTFTDQDPHTTFEGTETDIHGSTFETTFDEDTDRGTDKVFSCSSDDSSDDSSSDDGSTLSSGSYDESISSYSTFSSYSSMSRRITRDRSKKRHGMSPRHHRDHHHHHHHHDRDHQHRKKKKKAKNHQRKPTNTTTAVAATAKKKKKAKKLLRFLTKRKGNHSDDNNNNNNGHIDVIITTTTTISSSSYLSEFNNNGRNKNLLHLIRL
mmetsp:Transcript_18872/g.43523  ORF Transcript_18872/g.43523 Transcript_18872/m.43523 type:complete len:624 (+) Transcript_18872:139-2010(+)